jgi:hypothetical protein
VNVWGFEAKCLRGLSSQVGLARQNVCDVVAMEVGVRGGRWGSGRRCRDVGSRKTGRASNTAADTRVGRVARNGGCDVPVQLVAIQRVVFGDGCRTRC